jgi:hypothetical protein
MTVVGGLEGTTVRAAVTGTITVAGIEVAAGATPTGIGLLLAANALLA